MQCSGTLLRWCQAVCARYGVIVRDFSASMADGKALCLLIHHYNPELLPLDKIGASVQDRMAAGASPLTGKGGKKKSPLEAGLAAERANFALAKAQALQLGCIPFMGKTDASQA